MKSNVLIFARPLAGTRLRNALNELDQFQNVFHASIVSEGEALPHSYQKPIVNPRDRDGLRAFIEHHRITIVLYAAKCIPEKELIEISKRNCLIIEITEKISADEISRLARRFRPFHHAPSIGEA